MKKWFKDDKFVELSTDELKELSTDEVKEYMQDKMTVSVKLLQEKFNKENAERIESLKNEIEAIKKANKEADIKGMEQNIAGLNDAIKNLGNAKKTEKTLKTVFDVLEKNKDLLTDLKNYDNSTEINIETKDIMTDDISDPIPSQVIPGVTTPAQIAPSLYSAMRKTKLNGAILNYTDIDSSTDNASWLAERATIPQSEMEWINYTLSLKDVADSIRVSEQMIEDYQSLVATLTPFILYNISGKIETALYTGSGAGVNPNGIYTLAPAFNYAGYSGKTVSDPNLLDLAKLLKNEITKVGGKTYNVDTLFVNSDDMFALEVAKDANGRYLFDEIRKQLNIKIVSSPNVTANTLVIGDSRLMTIYQKPSVKVVMGHNGDDLTQRMRTIIAYRRMNLLVKNADKGAFLKVDDVDAALTAITTP